MTTTRKDLARIADAFAQTKPESWNGYGTDQWHADIAAVADALEVTTGFNTNGNRKFDRDRFYAACGQVKEGS